MEMCPTKLEMLLFQKIIILRKFISYLYGRVRVDPVLGTES